MSKKIEDLNITIMQLERDIEQSNVEISDREEAMKQMQDTLVKRGEQNKRLSITLTQIKNQIMEEQVFDQKFAVSQPGTLSTAHYTVSHSH